MIEPWTPTTRRTRQRATPTPTPAQRATAHRNAVKLCRNATSDASRRLADLVVRRWIGCGCGDIIGQRKS